MGLDRRRFRPNLVIGGVEGMAEREWEGRTLRIGDAAIAVAHLCVRCVITTIDPDSGELDPDVLRRVNAELDGKLALNCDVVEPGAVAVGDPVTVHS